MISVRYSQWSATARRLSLSLLNPSTISWSWKGEAWWAKRPPLWCSYLLIFTCHFIEFLAVMFSHDVPVGIGRRFFQRKKKSVLAFDLSRMTLLCTNDSNSSVAMREPARAIDSMSWLDSSTGTNCLHTTCFFLTICTSVVNGGF